MPPLDHAAPPANPSLQAVPCLNPATLLCGAAVALLVLLWWTGGGWVFPLDDAYITLHNVRVLFEGRDPNYGVSALVGATSLVHLALVAALSLLLPGELASYLVCCAGVMLFLAGMLALGRRQGLSGLESTALACAGLVTAAAFLLNGLETGLAMAGVTWALVLAAEAPSRRLALLCGTLPFLRPEIGLLSLALMARQAWLWTCAAPNLRAALADVGTDAALALAAAAPWLAWSFVETGAALPATIGAKQAFFGFEAYSLPVAMLLALNHVVSGLGPMAAALGLIRRDALAAALWVFVGLFILGYALTAPGILFLNEKRYTAILLPVALFALAKLAALRRRKLLHVLLLLQCVSGVAHLATLLPRLRVEQSWVRAHRIVGEWAQANLPAGSRLLIHDAGMIAYVSDLPLTDLVGLKSPDSITDHRRWTQPSRGAERFRAIAAIARRSGATHALILHDEPGNFWTRIADELRRAGWSVDPLDFPGSDGPYKLYRLTAPLVSDDLTPDQAPDSAGTPHPH